MSTHKNIKFQQSHVNQILIKKKDSLFATLTRFLIEEKLNF